MAKQELKANESNLSFVLVCMDVKGQHNMSLPALAFIASLSICQACMKILLPFMIFVTVTVLYCMAL